LNEAAIHQRAAHSPQGSILPATPSPSWRAVCLACAALVVIVNRQPQWAFNGFVRGLFGNPAWRGPWLLVEHTLLSGSLCTLAALLCWTWLARQSVLPGIRSLLGAPDRRGLWLGIAAGFAALALQCAALPLLHACGRLLPISFGYTPPAWWSLAGNLVSNFYEELVFRGFLLLALRAATGSTLFGALASSCLFGLAHEQYPLEEQLLIALAAALWSWLVLRTRSLWPAWLAHQLLDAVADSVLKA
jgi:membrane protease YdiL (CAAX protease family)